jgi:hypothetical protein
MDIQQMLERLLAGQEEMIANSKAWREEMAAERRARTEATRKRTDAKHEGMVAETKPERDIKTMACQEMEEHLEEKEPTSVARKPEVALR